MAEMILSEAIENRRSIRAFERRHRGRFERPYHRGSDFRPLISEFEADGTVPGGKADWA